MKFPNDSRTVLFHMAMVCFPRRHSSHKMEKRNVREKLYSFFEQGRAWRRWVKEQKLSNG